MYPIEIQHKRFRYETLDEHTHTNLSWTTLQIHLLDDIHIGQTSHDAYFH